VSKLLFWPGIIHNYITKEAGPRPNFAKRLLKDCGAIEGLYTSDTELVKLMKDRDEWRKRIKNIVCCHN
jgi:hypothetical protein